MLKSKDGTPVTKADLHKMISADPEMMKRVGKVMKDFNDMCAKSADGQQPNNEQLGQGPLDDQAQAALQAVSRILAPMKDKLSPVLLKSVLDAAGFNLAAAKSEGEGMEAEKSAKQSPEAIKEEHKIEAMKVAKEAGDKAYGEHLAKLGYQKYPTEQMAQKAVDHDPDQPAQDLEQSGNMHNPDREGAMKSISKSALKDLPKAAQEYFEQISKSHDETKMRLEAVLKSSRRKELVEKAEGYKHLGVATEKLADLFESLSEKSVGELETVLKAADAQVSKGALFAEFGSNQSSPLSSGPQMTWANIEQAAKGYVQKSGKTMSTPEAVDAFMKTPEGSAMYTQYKNELEAATRRG